MKLVEKFIDSTFDSLFLTIYARSFEELIKEARTNERQWKVFENAVGKHGLLDFAAERTLEIGPICLSMPDGSVSEVHPEPVLTFDLIHFQIDRVLLASEQYLKETAAILAYMLACRLLPETTAAEQIVLLHMDGRRLRKLLNRLGRHESTGARVANLILSDEIDVLSTDCSSFWTERGGV